MENNEIRTREQIAADIMGFFEDNESAFIECIEDIDNYNGYLGDDRYYEMEMLDEFFEITLHDILYNFREFIKVLLGYAY